MNKIKIRKFNNSRDVALELRLIYAMFRRNEMCEKDYRACVYGMKTLNEVMTDDEILRRLDQLEQSK